jgi:hypothetical protein
MSLITQMAADVARAVSDLPDEIVMATPDGRTLACVAGSVVASKRLTDEGFLPEYDLQVVVQNSLLVDGAGNDAPLTLRQQFTLTRTGLRYRIERLTGGADDAATVADCVQVTA